MSIYPHARYLLGADRLQQLPDDTGSEVAFAGRSNAGKSSAINAITHRQGLARSSKTPGRTRLINLFELESGRRIADLPGYGYANVPKEVQRHWRTLVTQYLQSRESLAGLFLVVDARRGVQSDELEVVRWARSRQLSVRILLSKSDKLTPNKGRQVLQAALGQLAGEAAVQLFSAPKKQGVEEAQRALEEMLAKSTPVERGAAPPGQTNPAWG